jgi:hypothetical protein
VIATDKGWKSERFPAFPLSLSLMIDGVVFVEGNGGANPVSVSMVSFASLRSTLSLFIIAPR